MIVFSPAFLFSAILQGPRGVSRSEPYITVPAIIYHFTTFYTNRSSKSPPARCLAASPTLLQQGETGLRKPKLTFRVRNGKQNE